jgi:hypothetical protein
MTVEEINELHRARTAARAMAKAATEIADFLDRASAVPDPAQLAEFANLLAREESAQERRNDACAAAGLEVDSIE